MGKLFKLHHSKYDYADDQGMLSYVGEKHPTARFVEEIAIKTKGGGYTPNPAVVFYQKNPPAPYTNNFFAYYRYPDLSEIGLELPNAGKWVITGLKDWDPVVDAILDEKEGGGVLTISRFVHDFVRSPVSGAFIDGGRDYCRTGGTPLPKIVKLNLFTMTFELNGETQYVER